MLRLLTQHVVVDRRISLLCAAQNRQAVEMQQAAESGNRIYGKSPGSHERNALRCGSTGIKEKR